MRKILFTLITFIVLIGQVQAKEFMGQLMTNYQTNAGDFFEFALVTTTEIIPLNIEGTERQRTLWKQSGDVIIVNGDVQEKVVTVSDPRDMHPGVDPGFFDPSEETVIEGINVVQFTLPILEYIYRGKLETKFVPELKTSIYLLQDESGMSRRFLMPKTEQEVFIQNYYDKNVEVKCRLMRLAGEDFYFIHRIDVLD